MKDFFKLVGHDIKKMYNYRIIHFVVVLTFMFCMTVWFLPDFGSANFLYLSIFVLPVIIFSISMFIEREEKTFEPLITSETETIKIVMAKILAAVTIEILPFIGYVIITLIRSSAFVNSIHINYFFLFLVYVMGVIVHIIIGLSLSIIAKTSRILSLSYLGYIVVFSLLPILYSNGIIPEAFQYYLIISPAYLSGVLIDYIIFDTLNPELWLIILSIVLQIIYAIVLIRFVIMPFFKQYVLATADELQK